MAQSQDRRMRIKHRGLLMLLLIAGQMACVIYGIIWTHCWLQNAFVCVVNNHVQSEGRSLAFELAAKISEMRLDSIEPGSPGWQQIQDLCANTDVRHNGYASVIRRSDGALIGHPRLADEPSLAKKFPGRALLLSDNAFAPITESMQEAEKNGSRLVAGQVELDGKLQVLAGSSLPRLDAMITVHQENASVQAFIKRLMRPVTLVCYVLAFIVLGGTVFITIILFGRYEDRLSKLNEKLGEEVKNRTDSLLRTRNAVVFGLAKLAESRDRDTGKHLESIRAYVTILASELAKTHTAIDQRFIADLAAASSLHDIGKVGIPDQVLLKPAQLTTAEKRAMQLHTLLGSECLIAIQKQLGDDDFLELAEQIAIAHHEHWDGGGYPYGLKGNTIPLAARIVALADVYDALVSSRPYKGPTSHAEAREWIVIHYGTQFDPDVVEAFIAREQDFIRINTSFADYPANSEAHDDFPEIPLATNEDLSLQMVCPQE